MDSGNASGIHNQVNQSVSLALQYCEPGIRKAFAMLALIALALLQVGCTGEGKSAAGTDLTDAVVGFDIPVFYVKRPIPENDLSLEEPYAFNPGAELFYRSSATTSGSEINISARAFPPGSQYDVKDLTVSADGRRLLFAMHPPEADPDNPVEFWDIWEYNINSDTLRKVLSDSFIAVNGQGHDINPAYLPTPNTPATPDPNSPEEIAIVFSSTRQETNQVILRDEFKGAFVALEEDSARQQRDLEDGAIQALTLHVFDDSLPDADKLRQISFNQSHDLDPMVLPSGRILFNRWDNVAGNDEFSIYSTTPTGAETTLIYGYHSNATSGSNGGEALITELQLHNNANTLMALQRERALAPEVLGGALVELDLTNYIDQNTPTFANAGLLNPAFTPVFNGDIFTDDRLSPDGRFSSFRPLNDGTGRILVSWSPCLVTVNGASSPCSINPTAPVAEPEYGVWLLDNANPGEQLLQLIVAGEAGFMYTDVMIAETRDEPAFVAPILDNFENSEGNAQAILNIESIYDLDGVDITPAGIAVQADPLQTDPATINAKFLRLVKAVSIPDETVHEFDNTAYGVNTSQLMREIIGYLPIEPDGSVRGLVPANVPFLISVVDATGKRISGRHQNWISLAPNETLQCVGCHTGASTEPHGRIDAQPPSINPGAPAPLGVWPNTEQNLGEVGDTMAEAFAKFVLPDPSPDPRERVTNADLVYVDDWTNESLGPTKSPAFTISYDTLTTASPENPFCNLVRGFSPPVWTPLCRIIINYEDHIQPIWEATRPPISDGTPAANMFTSCVGCHTTDSGSRVPAAQLDLTNMASDIEADHFTSYRELLRADAEQALDGGVVSERNWECTTLDPMGVPIVNIVAPPQIGPSMSEAGANFGASVNFFNCMTNDNACRSNFGAALPVDCVEIGGDPVVFDPLNMPVNHNGLLSAEELRLIAEWLDIGAQYYNNPFDAPTP